MYGTCRYYRVTHCTNKPRLTQCSKLLSTMLNRKPTMLHWQWACQALMTVKAARSQVKLTKKQETTLLITLPWAGHHRKGGQERTLERCLPHNRRPEYEPLCFCGVAERVGWGWKPASPDEGREHRPHCHSLQGTWSRPGREGVTEGGGIVYLIIQIHVWFSDTTS